MSEPSPDVLAGLATANPQNLIAPNRLGSARPVQALRVTRSFAQSPMDVERLASIVRRIVEDGTSKTCFVPLTE
jgi:hypothetical protein